jgi:hypothetical protein
MSSCFSFPQLCIMYIARRKFKNGTGINVITRSLHHELLHHTKINVIPLYLVTHYAIIIKYKEVFNIITLCILSIQIISFCTILHYLQPLHLCHSFVKLSHTQQNLKKNAPHIKCASIFSTTVSEPYHEGIHTEVKV